MPNEQVIDLTIRASAPNDAAVLAQLMSELGYETTQSEMEMRLARIVTDDRYRTFVAVRGGKVCGMIGTLTSLSYEHNEPGGRILALVTVRAMRRHGIGRALLATAEKDFAQRGIKRIALNTQLAEKMRTNFTNRLVTSETDGGL